MIQSSPVGAHTSADQACLGGVQLLAGRIKRSNLVSVEPLADEAEHILRDVADRRGHTPGPRVWTEGQLAEEASSTRGFLEIRPQVESLAQAVLSRMYEALSLQPHCCRLARVMRAVWATMWIVVLVGDRPTIRLDSDSTTQE